MSMKWIKIYRNTAMKPHRAATKRILETTITHAAILPIPHQSQKRPRLSFTDEWWVAAPQAIQEGHSESISNFI